MMYQSTDESVMTFEDVDFSDELPIPPDVCKPSPKLHVSAAEQADVKHQQILPTESAQADVRNAANVSDQQNDSFNRDVFVTCSTALGTPCYRNPVYGARSDRTDAACQRLASKHPQVRATDTMSFRQLIKRKNAFSFSRSGSTYERTVSRYCTTFQSTRTTSTAAKE